LSGSTGLSLSKDAIASIIERVFFRERMMRYEE
jgi:hypothetical protein